MFAIGLHRWRGGALGPRQARAHFTCVPQVLVLRVEWTGQLVEPTELRYICACCSVRARLDEEAAVVPVLGRCELPHGRPKALFSVLGLSVRPRYRVTSHLSACWSIYKSDI
jgi:hypothetical protein